MKKLKINKAGIITEPGNSVENKTGGWRVLKPIVNKKKCEGDGRCWAYCPDNAIKINHKTKKAEVDYDFCKGCGICANICPFGAIKMVEEEK
ncbi:pyruvate synthase [archaeon]|nr:pyruvate synthase [archaeon]|tara:strand:+ start:2202 stop:2477 length:276 start_codon:yes stop_codon:yes gene_type:complete